MKLFYQNEYFRWICLVYLSAAFMLYMPTFCWNRIAGKFNKKKKVEDIKKVRFLFTLKVSNHIPDCNFDLNKTAKQSMIAHKIVQKMKTSNI